MDCPATLLRRPIGMQQHDAPENQFASHQDGRTQTRVCGGVVFAPRPDSCTETIPFYSSENHGKVNDRKVSAWKRTGDGAGRIVCTVAAVLPVPMIARD